MYEEEHESYIKEMDEYCPGLYDEENNGVPEEFIPHFKFGFNEYNPPSLASVWDSLQKIANDDDSKLQYLFVIRKN
jgi:hypothetical protein